MGSKYPPGDPRRRMRGAPLADRLWSKIKKGRGCWEWQRGLSGNGRGYLSFQENGIHRQVSAHRLAYTLTYGEIPEGQHVLHHCDNALCVRPDHLYLGGHRENARDRAVRGRAHGKLSRPVAERARYLYENELANQDELARMFQVSHASMWRILRRRVYRDYPELEDASDKSA